VATRAAAIGAGGLGVFIFRGIATVNNTLLLAGALPSAAIALAADAALGALEKRLSYQSQGGTRQWRWQMGWPMSWQKRLAAALLVALLLLLAMPLAWRWGAPGAETAATVVIGAKGYTEQLILGELLAQEIEAKTPCQATSAFGPLATRKLVHLMGC
jgi:osmoprotectant transport system permease protein